MMYIWNTKSLAQDLMSGKVAPKEKIKSLLLLVILMALFAFSLSKGFLYINSAAAILSLVLLGSGYFFAAKKNALRDGKDFALRAITLTPPLFLKVFVGLGLFFLIARLVFPEFSLTSLFLIPTWIVFTGIYLKWFLAQIEEISRPKVSWEAHQGI